MDLECFSVIKEEFRRFIVAASNPDKEGKTLKMRVNKKLIGGGADAVYDVTSDTTTLTFKLPGHRYAGKSVLRTFVIE